jgi:hypothetical protein
MHLMNSFVSWCCVLLQVIQTICGQRHHLGRKMTSKESRILYGELRRDIAARESVHVTPLSVDILKDDISARLGV